MLKRGPAQMPKPKHAPPAPTLFDETASQQLLLFMCKTLLALLTIAVSLSYLLGNTRNVLLMPAALICVLAAIVLVAMKKGHTRGAGQVLMWGAWAAIVVSAPFGSGNRSVGMSGLPLLIVMQGWLIGPRHAIGMTGATLAALLGISLSEHYGWVTMAGPVAAMSRWITLCAIVLSVCFLTVLSHRVYASRYAEQQRLAATLALVTEHSPIMLAAVNADGTYRYVNQNYASFHGKRVEALIGTPVADTAGEEKVIHIRQLLANQGTGTYRCQGHNHQTGAECWLEISVRQALRNDDAYDGYYAILRDITDEVRTAEQINFMAYHDALTGLPNRPLLTDRLLQMIARSTREDSLVLVCYLDLDGFKFINDTWGHSTGDQILVQVASRLQECVRGTDTVARMGGDEFVVLIGGLNNRKEIPVAINRLLTAITPPMQVGNNAELSVSASIGVAVCPFDGEDPDVLIRRADQAMLMVKQSGKNRFALFDTELEQRTRTLYQIAANVETGLAEGQFVLFYQPKVNMRLGTVIGLEALIRWQHPEDGLLLPASFLPYIEGSPVAIRLGQWVLSEALAQMNQWATQGLHLPVSVNISGQHLLEADFALDLATRLNGYPDLPATLLEIEILETTAMEDVEKVARIIRNSSALGVGFALDDFGTGYSTLTYFRRLPAQTLKIDKSFVRDILEDPEDLAIVRGVVALAESFGRRVIAEGVETAGHGIPLLGIGCDCAQGYGIARPMPAELLPEWLAAWQAPAIWKASSQG